MKGFIEPKIVMLEKFRVRGISTKTSNEHEMQGNGKIPELWMRFQNERIIEQIPNRMDSSIVAVYTDYESDENGVYTLVVGGKINHPVGIPNNMEDKEVPGGKYLVFTSPQGLISKVVFETWEYIWKWFSYSDLKRSYVADFELYDERSIDPNSSQVEIFIGLA